jgi:AbrB family looped-hinge helix DNA binding protein
MKERLSIVTRKGQITLPAEIRAALGLKRGDKVALTLSDPGTGTVSLKPVRSVAEMTYGAIPARKQPEDFAELRRLFEEGTAEEAGAEGLPERNT